MNTPCLRSICCATRNQAGTTLHCPTSTARLPPAAGKRRRAWAGFCVTTSIRRSWFCVPRRYARARPRTWCSDVLDYDPEVRLVDGLYNFGDGTGLLHIIQQIGTECSELMIIGHNPSLENLAVKLAGSGRSADLKDMARKYPTAALAIIEFEGDDWADIRAGKGRLHSFTRPKALYEA